MAVNSSETPHVKFRAWLAGMVSGVVFTDIDGDADCDLVLAIEWGSLEVLLNDRGRFRRATDEWGLSGF
ncbi:MAG: hypothetical protein M2R45_04293 [Verrucomicrobia subdivision 3 bacterium]|nr:hypothetical protein [Limisphaerales bacterium]MCS1417208.1 hypothetical protein [Limisphaerales bacterium]